MKDHTSSPSGFFGSDACFRLLVESIQDYAIFLLDPQGKVMSWNAGARKIHHENAADIIGKNFSAFYTSEDRKSGHPKALLRTAEHSGRAMDEGWHVRGDGAKFWADTLITALRNERGQLVGFAKITRDASARRETELRKASFVSAASHQLRTPLSSILWSLELLRDEESKLTAVQRKNLLDETMKGGRFMAEIIEVMLMLTRIEEKQEQVKTTAIDVAELLQQMKKIHMLTLKQEDVAFTVRCPRGLTIHTDRNMLTEILSNLLNNAIQYTPPRGKIAMTATKKPNAIVFTVTDTGIGIPQKEQERIFDRFFRASNAREHVYSGTGLGLFLARTLATLCGGTIGFTSREQEGSSFWVSFPVEVMKKAKHK